MFSVTRYLSAFELQSAEHCEICFTSITTWKSIWAKSYAAMLTRKWFWGVHRHVGDEEGKWWDPLWLRNQKRYHQKSKRGVSVTPRNGLMSTENSLFSSRECTALILKFLSLLFFLKLYIFYCRFRYIVIGCLYIYFVYITRYYGFLRVKI